MRSNRLGWILLAPTMIILFLFGVVPFLYIIWLSFHQWNPAAVNPDIIFIGADGEVKAVMREEGYKDRPAVDTVVAMAAAL